MRPGPMLDMPTVGLLPLPERVAFVRDRLGAVLASLNGGPSVPSPYEGNDPIAELRQYEAILLGIVGEFAAMGFDVEPLVFPAVVDDPLQFVGTAWHVLRIVGVFWCTEGARAEFFLATGNTMH